ncbi:MAG: HNH endonuclease, partial [Firmicutes bacterium]|nr:HNH endonuclease [Bacillota bacterium]
MEVYVQDKYGRPLMPTERYGKVRRLLKAGKAKVVKRCPFTIRLLYDTGSIVQEVDLGIDAGSKTIGLSACTKDREVYAAEIMLRQDVTERLSERREYRRSRRNRKTRYRSARFDNRVRSKHKGWLAPSIEVKIASHLKAVEDICSILPISHITVETASFDLQKIKAELNRLAAPKGTDYQQGEQLGFWNVREYVLFRDGHTCRCCKGKSKDKRLNVHHLESRKTGGDAPNNLITLCETCHSGYHEGTVTLPGSIRRGASFRDAAFMGIMRWTLYRRLKELYPGKVSMTYGYITKNIRI